MSRMTDTHSVSQDSLSHQRPFSSGYIHAMAKCLSNETYGQWAQLYNPVRLSQLRLSFVAWANDFGQKFTTAYAAWEVFVKGNYAMEKRIRLDSEDIQNYVDSIGEVSGTGAIPGTFTPLLISQAFVNDTYIGSWIPCTVDYSMYFWLVFDESWNCTIHYTNDERIARMNELAGDKTYTFYYYTWTEHIKVYEGTYPQM